jgi:hypothetical protein
MSSKKTEEKKYMKLFIPRLGKPRIFPLILYIKIMRCQFKKMSVKEL